MYGPMGSMSGVGRRCRVAPRTRAAKAAGVEKDKVTIHSHMLGGGFGRRLEAEYVGIATALAKQVPYPLKMIWTRETDIQRDRYRPFYYDKVSAGIDAEGRIVGWAHKVTGSSVMARWAPPGLRKNGIDPDAVECVEETPYEMAAHHVSWVRHEPPGVITAWWRGVGPGAQRLRRGKRPSTSWPLPRNRTRSPSAANFSPKTRAR